MANVFRVCPSTRIRPTNLVNQALGGVSQLIANEFWTYTAYGGGHVTLTIRNAAGALVINTWVQYAIFEYGSGQPSNVNWMYPVSHGIALTSDVGVLDILYSGVAGVGETIYVSVLHPSASPTESFIWTDTVK